MLTTCFNNCNILANKLNFVMYLLYPFCRLFVEMPNILYFLIDIGNKIRVLQLIFSMIQIPLLKKLCILFSKQYQFYYYFVYYFLLIRILLLCRIS